MADPDWTNPCAVLEWLRPQYYKVMAGLAEVTTQDGDTSVTYTQANKAELGSLMRQLESECAKRNGTSTGRRRAFVAG
jgi:hypothetical protein